METGSESAVERDLRTVVGNVRRFRLHYRDDSRFREWVRTEASSETHDYLLQEMVDDHEIGNLVHEDLESERS